MIQQQQVYPPFGQKMATAKSAAEALVKAEDDTSSIESMSGTPSGVAVCVIKETESVLKASTMHNNNNNSSNDERCRSESPVEMATRFNGVIKTTDLMHGIGRGVGIGIGGPLSLSPNSVVTKAAITAIATATPTTITTQQTINELTKYHTRRYMKRSNSFDDDDELYDAEAEDRIISKQYERRAKQQHYDSEPENPHGDDEPIAYNDYNGRYTTDDDEPLDLSLSTERRQRIHNHNYSDTESDDSAGTGEEKASGKAAYKKNLMKRYRK